MCFRYIYQNVTNSAVDNSTGLTQNPSSATLNNDSSRLIISEPVEINIGLAADRIYNVLYENVAYCLVAFLVPLTTLLFFNVRLVVQLRRSRQLRRTLRPLHFSTAFSGSSALRGRAAVGQEDGASASGLRASCSGHDETNITLVMVVIIVVFIVCQLPASANQVSTDSCKDLQFVIYWLTVWRSGLDRRS